LAQTEFIVTTYIVRNENEIGKTKGKEKRILKAEMKIRKKRGSC
jgi:hypothetical protein